MGNKIRSAARVYRRDGLFALAEACGSYVHRIALEPITDSYWAIKGRRSFTVAGTTATFDTSQPGIVGRTRGGLDREREMLESVLENLHEDDVFFDVGANVGLYTVFASRKATRGRVIAFEPYPPNITQLRRNAELNGSNIEVVEFALSDRDGTVQFDQPDSDTVGAGLPAISPADSGQTTRVETVRGDSLVSDGAVPQPNVVKIDVEGAEPLVIDGMREALSNDECRALYCETHLPAEFRSSIEDYGSSLMELKRTIRELGFEITAELPREDYNDIHIVAEKGD